VSVNKHDLNPAMATRLERRAAELGATVGARFPDDPAVTTAQRPGRPVVELDHGPAAEAIAQLWQDLWNNSPFTCTNPLSGACLGHAAGCLGGIPQTPDTGFQTATCGKHKQQETKDKQHDHTHGP
jgi:hypothetical protein